MKKFFMVSFLLIFNIIIIFSYNINATEEGEEPDTNLCAKKFKTMEAGMTFSIALSDEGKVYTWGGNKTGQLGLGYTNDYGEGINRVTPVAFFDNIKVKAVSPGFNFALALSEDGEVYSWGGNASGALGIGVDDDAINQTLPKKIEGLENITMIQAGGNSAFAIDADGNVYSWGENINWQLGYQEKDGKWGQTKPLLVNYFKDNNIKIKQISNVMDYTLFLTDDGDIYGSGNMKTDIFPTKSLPNLINTDVKFSKIDAANIKAALLLSTDKKVYFLGDNANYQSGISEDGITDSYVFNTPTIIPDLQDMNFVDISIQNQGIENFSGISLAITDDNVVYGWGGTNPSGEYGVIGSGNSYRKIPEKLSDTIQDYKLTQISVGFGFVLATNEEGSSFGWGANNEGQVGLGITTKSVAASVIGDVRCPVDFEKSYYQVSEKYVPADGASSVDLDVVLINEDGGYTTSIFPGALSVPKIADLTISEFVFDKDTNKYVSKITSNTEGNYPIESVKLEEQELENQVNKIANFGVAKEVEPTTPEIVSPDGEIEYPIKDVDGKLVMDYDFACDTVLSKEMFKITEQEGIDFTTTIEDGKLIVKASPKDGYEFKEGSITEWSIQLPEVKHCDIKVDYLSVKANGSSTKVKSTLLTLKFSREITDLSVNDIIVSTKTKSNNNYTLRDLKHLGDGTYEVAINGDWANGTEVSVSVSKTGYEFNVDFNSVTLYNVTDDGGNNGNNGNGNGNGNGGHEGNTNETRPLPETGNETMLIALVAMMSGASLLIIRKKLIK